MNINFGSIGVILAVIVLLLAIVFGALKRVDPVTAALIAVLSLAVILS